MNRELHRQRLKHIHCICAIANSGLYISTPLFKGQKYFFFLKVSPYACLIFKNNLSRVDYDGTGTVCTMCLKFQKILPHLGLRITDFLAIFTHDISYHYQCSFMNHHSLITQNTYRSIEKISILLQLQEPGTKRTLYTSIKRAGHYLIQIQAPYGVKIYVFLVVNFTTEIIWVSKLQEVLILWPFFTVNIIMNVVQVTYVPTDFICSSPKSV